MRKITKAGIAAGLATAAAATIGLTAVNSADAADRSYQGCPYGAVCVYPRDADWNNGRPSDVYYSYGVHELRNQVGYHKVFNNQWGSAGAKLCRTYSGTNCVHYYPQYTADNYDLTPINSIVLVKG